MKYRELNEALEEVHGKLRDARVSGKREERAGRERESSVIG